MSYAPAEAASATDTLKQPPFAPTDISLFDPHIYENAPPLAPPSSGPTGEAEIRALLSSSLKERLGYRTKAQKKKVKKALATFDSANTKQVISDPRLRAALVSLTGTLGEPAIAGMTGGI